MPAEEWALVACVVFSGIWFGFLCMLTLILHPMLKSRDVAGFRGFLGEFLPIARARLVQLPVRGRPDHLARRRAVDARQRQHRLHPDGVRPGPDGHRPAGGLEPAGRAELRRDPRLGPELAARGLGEGVSSRYFAYNWIRFACTGGAFVLFLAALIEQLR